MVLHLFSSKSITFTFAPTDENILHFYANYTFEKQANKFLNDREIMQIQSAK